MPGPVGGTNAAMLVGGRPAPLGPRHGAAPAVPSLVGDGGDRTQARAAASRAFNYATQLAAACDQKEPACVDVAGVVAQKTATPFTSELRQRRTRGIPRPIQEMISRWISLLPPPKVKMTAER